MKRLFTLLFISLLTIFVSAQEYYGAEASRLISGAEKVWIPQGKSLPAYIKMSVGHHFPLSQLKSRITEFFDLEPQFGIEYSSTQNGINGQQHHRFYLTWNGMRVHNGMFVAHTKNDMVYALNGSLFSQISPLNTNAMDEQSALQRALDYYGSQRYIWEDPAEEALLKLQTGNPDTSYFPKGRLVVVPDYLAKEAHHYIAWMFNIYATYPLRRGEVFVDAQSGNIIFENKLIRNIDSIGTAVTKYSGTQTITTDYFNGTFRLRESGRGIGIETFNMQNGTSYAAAVDFTDADNYWNNVNAQKDEIATDAHWGAEMTYDYFFHRHNRNSIDDNGFKLRSYVHYNTNYANAFWDGQRMTYGDGNNNIGPLVALDICAHEISHGLTSFTANLTYQDESGAINESFSDIFGTSTEFYAKPAAANWTVGENIGLTLRSMSNPKAYGDPNCYEGINYYVGPNDNGGVHTNCGVLNYWFYLLSQGGSGTNDKGHTYSVSAISIDSAARVAYRMLTVYLINSSGFDEARFFGIQSALDLFGPCSPQVAATTNAFYAVGIGSSYVPGVQANFSSPLTEFCDAPAQVSFTNLSNNANAFIWHFGDGNTSTQLNPVHTYASGGAYTVKLVSDGGSCGRDSLQKIAYININPANRCPHNMPVTGTQTLTTCTGRLFDSGGLNNYHDNRTVTSVLAPHGASQITLTFLKFAFESGYDYLHIYDGPTAQSPKIGSFDGTSLPGQNGIITSTGGNLTLVQETDQALNLEGFELLWDCIYPTAPPVASFEVSDTVTCTGVISFTDRSSNGPVAWLWEFGDGNFSALQNPTHTYTTPGYYTVKLTATNSFGLDISILSQPIHADLPDNPVVVHSANCGPASFVLSANVQNGTLLWYDAPQATVPVATGSSFSPGFLTQTTTFWVENTVVQSSKYTGKTDNSGGGAYFTAAAVHYLVFDAHKPFILKSVKVYAQNAGNRTVSLRDASGAVIESKVINIPAGTSRITLDFEIPAGNNYRLACSQSSGLYRNNAGCSYPYEINGLLSIKYSSATSAPTSYYYFFYDWEVKEEDCSSLRYPVTAFVSGTAPSAAFTFTMNDPVVHFSDQTSEPGICSWDFGDGNTAGGNNPTHVYTANGVYNVKMTVNNGCGIDSTVQQLTIVATGLSKPAKHSDIKLYPNPANEKIFLTGRLSGNNKTLSVFDIRGSIIVSLRLPETGEQLNESFDLSNLIAGIYVIQISSSEHTEVFRLIKQ